jgi:hypothetical protein
MNCPNCETSGAYTGLRTANRIFDDIFLYEKAEKLILLRGEIGKDDVDDT